MFTINDTVISVCPLIAPPVEPPGVRLEIPAASRGTVVDVRPYDYPYPYVVVFEVGEGGLVEIDVTEEQIASVVSHAPLVHQLDLDLPPLTVRIPKRRINKQNAYTPTHGNPHHRCKLLHRVHLGLLLVLYGSALERYALWVLLVTVAATCLVYGSQLFVHRRWAWVPQAFRQQELPLTERFATHGRYLKYVVPSDVAFAVSVAALWVFHVSTIVNPVPALTAWYGSLYTVLWCAAAVALVLKTVLHHLALEIVPRQMPRGRSQE